MNVPLAVGLTVVSVTYLPVISVVILGRVLRIFMTLLGLVQIIIRSSSGLRTSAVVLFGRSWQMFR